MARSGSWAMGERRSSGCWDPTNITGWATQQGWIRQCLGRMAPWVVNWAGIARVCSEGATPGVRLRTSLGGRPLGETATSQEFRPASLAELLGGRDGNCPPFQGHRVLDDGESTVCADGSCLGRTAHSSPSVARREGGSQARCHHGRPRIRGGGRGTLWGEAHTWLLSATAVGGSMVDFPGVRWGHWSRYRLLMRSSFRTGSGETLEVGSRSGVGLPWCRCHTRRRWIDESILGGFSRSFGLMEKGDRLL